MIIPAASMVPPQFSASAPLEVNYATFGSLVGHELIHVAENFMFDGQGRRRNVWTEEDVSSAQRELSCVAARLEEVGVDGEQCKDETSADFGGLRAAYDAFRVALMKTDRALAQLGSDGLTVQQRFFVAYAQDDCTKMTDAYAIEAAQTDWHAPPRVRINLSVGNMPEFAEAFACPSRPPICEVW